MLARIELVSNNLGVENLRYVDLSPKKFMHKIIYYVC